MKKIFNIGLCLILITTLSGCQWNKLTESGDFKYHLRSDCAYIHELSELGKTKETIIFPNRIDGYNICIGYKTGMYTKYDFVIHSDELKKMYFNGDILETPYSNNAVHFGFNTSELVSCFFPYYNDNFYNGWGHAGLLYISNEYATPDDPQIINNSHKNINSYTKIANVSYYYNYERDGYKTYFIDDVDGETIKNIPPTPIREGYTFDGWYKEAECINQWDFNNDKIPSKEYDEEENYQYSETILYAKWK